MLERLSGRDKILLLILLIAVVGFCFYHFILTKQLEAYSKVKSELAENQAKLTQALAQSASLQIESSKLDKAKNDIKATGKYFETEMRDGSSVIILGLDGIFAGVDITSLEPGNIKEDPILLEMPVKITAQGNYREMLHLCEDIENMTNLTEVQGLKMESVSGTNDVKMTADMTIFSAKTPQGRLSLEDVSRWLTGRYNIFRPAVMIAPIPELTGKIINPVSPPESTGSPPEGTGSVQNTAGGSDSGTAGVSTSGSDDELVPPQSEYIWKK
ncbi:MAG TPA: hypothetical protein DCK76_01790 [Desulfotomaculum sp.]|nr:MAG: hypothetical protein XD78_0104 [Desulfotomaculum sp. 46_296]HAG10132.1 hypothetical protein [Desulfotomaculum sp.]HBY03677.1 hypothetical protein [Desulfotomaculum sp.]